MKTLACFFLLTFTPFVLQSEKWERVYTGTDMIIEIDASQVTFVKEHIRTKVTFAESQIGRVKFRTIYERAQKIEGTTAVEFSTRVESYDFNCGGPPHRISAGEPDPDTTLKQYPPPVIAYRLYKTTLLSREGKEVKTFGDGPTAVWKDVKFASMMDRLATSACRLIEEKRRQP